VRKATINVPPNIAICFNSPFSLLIWFLRRILFSLLKRKVLYEKLMVHFTSPGCDKYRNERRIMIYEIKSSDYNGNILSSKTVSRQMYLV